MLTVDTWPDLRDPVLVIALEGWVDAGQAASTAAEVLRDQLGAARAFARLDLADLVDLQQTRPEVTITRGLQRRVEWPEIECVAGRAGRDVVVCTGPEPSLRWPSVVATFVDAAVRLGVRQAVALGAMPAAVSHRRGVEVLATVTAEGMTSSAPGLRADYTGITGFQTALLVALQAAGIPGTALWAQVPHYVAGSPSPPAARALLAHLAADTGITVVLDALDEETGAYERRVEAGLADRPDVAELVEAIEAERAESGAELVTEIEEFLRDHDDGA